MTRFEEIMANEEFVNNLENTASYEELAEAFAKEGVNIEEIMSAEDEDAELSEDDLANVAGGVSSKDLARIEKVAIKTLNRNVILCNF